MMKPVSEDERRCRSRRKLGLAQEFKAEDLPVHTRRVKVVVQAPESVALVVATTPELRRDSQNAVAVNRVATPFFSLVTNSFILG